MKDLANKLRALCTDECRNRIDYRCVVCRGADAVERLAAAEAAARILFDDLSQFTRVEWLLERWPWLKDEVKGELK